MYRFLFFFVLIGCNSNSGKINGVKLPSSEKFSLKFVDSLNLNTPNKVPTEYSDGFILNDSLFYGIGFNNTIEVFNLKKENHLKSIFLDRNFIRGDIQNIVVKSIDSIYVFNSYPPKMFLINISGDIIDDYNFGNLPLKINRNDLPENEILYTIPKYYGYIKPQIVKDKLYLPIAPIGAEEMEGFTQTERIGIYNISNKNWEKAIVPPKGILSKLNLNYYNYDLMQTYFLIVDKNLYVNYPMNNYSYRYTLDGVFIDSVNTSSNLISKIPPPLSKKEIFDRQKSWNFRITTPFYGPLFYHEESKVFTRTAYEQQALKLQNNKLNNGYSRNASLIVFNKSFTIKNEYMFHQATLGIGKNYPLKDGIIVGRQENHWKNENEFIHKYVYKILNNEN